MLNKLEQLPPVKALVAFIGLIVTSTNPAHALSSVPANVRATAVAGYALITAAWMFGQTLAKVIAGKPVTVPPTPAAPPELLHALDKLRGDLGTFLGAVSPSPAPSTAAATTGTVASTPSPVAAAIQQGLATGPFPPAGQAGA